MARVAASPIERDGVEDISVATMIRWSGMLAIVAGAITIVVPFVHPSDDAGIDSAAWVPVHLLYFIGLMLLQLALISILAAQFRAAGRLGVAGFLVAFLGTAMMLMEGREHLFSPDFGDEDAMRGLWQLILASVVFSVGFILLGIAIRRAGVLPAASGILLAVGGPIVAFSPPIGVQAVLIAGSVLLGAGLAWVGYRLWAGAGRAPVA